MALDVRTTGQRSGSARQAPERTARPASGVRAWLRAAGEQLGRPLTPYYLILGSSALLLAIGLMEVLSASSVDSYTQFGNSYHWFFRQLLWVAIAVPTAYVAARLPHRVLRKVSWPSILVSIVLLVLTQTSLGTSVNGNQNWLGVGPLQIQPSEIAKLSIILWCADMYSRKEKLLRNWRHIVMPVVPVVGLIVLLVLLGGDLGTGLILFALLLGMLWVVGAPARLFLAAASVVSVLALGLATTSPYRLKRLTTFTDPFAHFQGDGWQTAHGILGMASGGLLGKGIGASAQKWGNLPFPHTDFIFAVLGEELGLVGTLLVLVLFFVIAYCGIRIAVRTPDPFVRYMAAGITIWLTAQMIVNIGMVLALLPVIGVPLPLVSYGGSSLVPEIVGLGLLLAFARHDPEAARALRGRRRQARGVSGRSTRARSGGTRVPRPRQTS